MDIPWSQEHRERMRPVPQCCLRVLAALLIGSLVGGLAGPAAAGPLAPDPTFGGDGRVRVGTWNAGYREVAERDGFTYLAGIENGAGSGENALTVVKRGPAGRLLASTTQWLSCLSSPVPVDVLLDDSGNVFVAGFNYNGLPGHAYVAAFDTDLNPLTGYGDPIASGCGLLVEQNLVRVDRDLAEVTGAAIDASGRIVMLGRVYNDLVVLRITADGELDATYGEGGLARLRLPETAETPGQVAIDSTGRAVVSAITGVPGYNQQSLLARFDQGGELDATFGTAGVRTLGGGSTSEIKFARFADDRLVVVRADAVRRVKVQLLAADGTLEDFGLGTSVVRRCEWIRRIPRLSDLVLRDAGRPAVAVFLHCKSALSPSMVLGLRRTGQPAIGFGDTGLRHLRSADQVFDAETTADEKFLYVTGAWLYRTGT